ncbi:hypothetical protein [Xanthomonas vasicola]|uniref:Uncharacterized protein n=1 Tax=Xanthomonas vasicola TaxID=56459 RepID=A0ABD7SFA1_XANVA|nr:hypothetical protein [Xanthomonas vasicola]AZR23516.1 hypothetical protein NX81_015815 [Xanthomonas vasicola]AZR34415.1 hypothetical protein NX08_007870 [Xanthomonas vasicola]KGR44228.1 hypothetical protein NX05_09700 [Xanthomonas vasicola]KGR44477.1 hypothetical protein NX04_07070 [Xanthomonas vasicola]KGR51453.1 hypothetical protein NX07_13495 [Xanthomonas vasicola]
MVIFLGNYQLTCHAAKGDTLAHGWVAGWDVAQIGVGRAANLAGAALSSTFPDHRSAMAAARIAGMVTLEAMYAKAQEQRAHV